MVEIDNKISMTLKLKIIMLRVKDYHDLYTRNDR